MLLSWSGLSTRVNQSASSEALSQSSSSSSCLGWPLSTLWPCQITKARVHILIWVIQDSQFSLKISPVDNSTVEAQLFLCCYSHTADGKCVLRWSQSEIWIGIRNILMKHLGLEELVRLCESWGFYTENRSVTECASMLLLMLNKSFVPSLSVWHSNVSCCVCLKGKEICIFTFIFQQLIFFCAPHNISCWNQINGITKMASWNGNLSGTLSQNE